MRISEKTYKVRRLPSGDEIVIDGYGRDAAWELAEILEDFTFPWVEGEPPKTKFRSLWDSEKIFFYFDVSDDNLVLADGINVKQRVLGSDRVEFFFSTGLNLDPYYGLEMDPRGEILSYRAQFHHRIEWDWNCEGLQVLAKEKSGGYIVEGSIPLNTLENLRCLHKNSEGTYLIAGLFRGEFSKDRNGCETKNWMSWVDPEVKYPDFHVPSAFGKLQLSEFIQ